MSTVTITRRSRGIGFGATASTERDGTRTVVASPRITRTGLGPRGLARAIRDAKRTYSGGVWYNTTMSHRGVRVPPPDLRDLERLLDGDYASLTLRDGVWCPENWA